MLTLQTGGMECVPLDWNRTCSILIMLFELSFLLLADKLTFEMAFGVVEMLLVGTVELLVLTSIERDPTTCTDAALLPRIEVLTLLL